MPKNRDAYASPMGNRRRRAFAKLWPDYHWADLTDTQIAELDLLIRDAHYKYHVAQGTTSYMRIRRGLDRAGFSEIPMRHAGWELLRLLVGPALDEVLGELGEADGEGKMDALGSRAR